MKAGLIKFLSILIILFFIHSIDSYSHHKTIKGRVLIKNGSDNPVIGASVRLANTVFGTYTNREGYFTIKRVPDGKYTIVISAIGMKTIQDTIELIHEYGDELIINYEMEETSIQASNIVVTATKSEKIYEDTPVKVSTIDKRQIEICNTHNIREALQYLPGIRTEINCQNCGFSQVRINGMEGKYSQILIDGKPIFSSLNGVYGLDQIPTNLIDRIEVIKGGGSSLYGGNAIAGVINILTKDPGFNSFSINLTNTFLNSFAQERTLNLNGSIISDNQELGLSIFGNIQKRDEYDANGDGFSEIGRLKLNTFGIKQFWKIDKNNKLTFEFHSIFHFIRGGNNLDLKPHQADICETAEHQTYLGQLVYDLFNPNSTRAKAYISLQNTRRESYYGANQDPNAYGSTDNLTLSSGIQYSFLYELLGTHIIIAGYEFNLDDMVDKAPAYNRNIMQLINSNGIFFQDDWNITNNLSFLLGFRVDKHNLIKKIIFNPRTSLMWRPDESITLRTTYSVGYRAPQAFDEDLHITQVGGEGILITLSEDLKPEYSNSISLSADYTLIQYKIPLSFSIDLFYTELTNSFILIDKGSNNDGSRIFERSNGTGADIKGITIEVQSDFISDIYFKSSLTYQKSRFYEPIEWSAGNEENGISSQFSNKFFKSPSFYAFFLIAYKLSKAIEINLSANYTGNMYIPHYAGYIEQDQLKRTEPFFELNTLISYKIRQSPLLRFSIGCYNLLNQYQKDFDIGPDRDAGYFYGPFKPFSPFIKFEFEY